MEENNENKGLILIVDDTPASISLIRTVLKEAGYQVRIAKNGKVALERVISETPDLILLDIMMHDMNGYETCAQIKKIERFSEIPIIFMSALTDTLDKVKAFETGAIDYVMKPVEPQELLVRISTHLKISRLERELQKSNKYLEERINVRTDELMHANAALKNEIMQHEKTDSDLIGTQSELRSAYEQLAAKEELIRNNFNELIKSQEALAQARKKLNVFNTVTFQDIQNAVFCLSGY